MAGGRNAVYDKSLGTVHVWSKRGNVPPVVANLLDARVAREGHVHGVSAPARADWYVITGAATKGHTLRANKLGCVYGAITLPDMHDWLAPRIKAETDRGVDVVVWVP